MLKQQKTEKPAGVAKKPALRVVFDSRLKLEFHGSKVTSDAGLLAYRELDAALGLTDLGDNLLSDWRSGKNTQHSMVALMRQSIFSRLAGYEDTNDAERLSVDPTMRQVVGGRATEHTAASTSQMGRFETEVLTQPSNLKALTKMSGKWIDRLRERQPMRELILDMDSSVSETYGEQEGTAFNGHFGCTCYHPLFCFNQFGDVEVKGVRNEMTIATAPATPDSSLSEKIDDASITAEVKATLLAHRSTSALRTKIETTDGVVTVTGVARNAAEKTLVTKLVADVNGVSNVINNMTVEFAAQ